MDIRNAFRKMLSDYIIIQAEIALSIGIIGSFFAGDEPISYHYFFLPAILGLVCMLPCLITYFKEDMTIRQIILQRVIEFLVIEAAIIASIYYIVGDALGLAGYIVMFFSILFFDILTYGLSYWFEKKDADAINRKLKADRERE
ncbi:MAG: DUF3021 family protein [Lachnospiraceae bacterium]|nr:DUF3021 family protein [Lachnospiraceae bacterium]